MTQGLTELTNHIIEEARNEARQEEERGRVEAERLRAEFLQATNDMVAEIQRDYQQRLQDEQRRIKSQTEMETKLGTLQAKQSLLTEAFELAKGKLLNLSDDEKRRIYLKRLLEVAEHGDEQVALAAGEQALGSELIKEANKELVKSGRLGQLRLMEEPAEIDGGFILYGRNYEVNASISVLLSNLEENLRSEVAQRLLAGDAS